MSSLRVMLIDENPERQQSIHNLLANVDCTVVGVLGSCENLLDEVEQHRPDVVIIDMESPSRDTLESLANVQATAPHAMVMFSQDSNSNTIRRATEAGVSAYVVDGISANKVRPLLEAAVARFEQFNNLNRELHQAREQLAGRKRIERAKGIIMTERNISEEEAYKLMRKVAMNQNRKLAEVADGILSTVELLRQTPVDVE